MNHLVRFTALLCIWMRVVFPSDGQSIVNFERIFINEGLSNNSINSVLQTADGFLWIATKDGLNRYDGQNFRVFKYIISDTTSLAANYVMSLAESDDSILWIGTWGGGLQRYDRIDESFTSMRIRGFEDDYIQCIYTGDHKNLWFGTTHGGLFRISLIDGKVQNYSSRNSLSPFPSDNITCITGDDSQGLWIGTWDAGLVHFNPQDGSYISYKHTKNAVNTLSDNGIWHITLEEDNILLLSTFSGVDHFNPETGKVINKEVVSPEFTAQLRTPIRQTFRDRKGRLWIGTYEYHGLFLSEHDGMGNNITQHFKYEDDNENSISIDRIRCIFEDMKGNLWIGTENGLNKFAVQRPFRQYRYLPARPKSLGGRVVSSFCEDTRGRLWVGYGGGGIDRIDPETGTIKNYRNIPGNDNSLSNNDVTSIYQDSQGYLWICTMYGGLNRLDPEREKWERYMVENSGGRQNEANWIHQVIETSEGQFLAGTNKGLKLFDRNTGLFSSYRFETIDSVENIPDDLSVNVLFEDSRKNFWIGTWLDGVFCYNFQNKKLNQYIPVSNDPSSISSDKITVIHENSDGLWFGTHSGGLNRFNIETGLFIHYDIHNGLPNDVVFGIQTDRNSDLWVSTMSGLARIDHALERIRVFDELDGLVDNQFNWRASYQDKKGNMYFGGINGFISFSPEAIFRDTIPPPVAITSFTVFNKETDKQEYISPTREIILDYRRNFFSIEFNALDMAPVQKHQYAYMLEGIDNGWVYSGNRNIAYYTDLHHGDFRFMVKASNSDGIWSEPVSLQVTILPAWYNTFWIKLAGLFTIFGIGIIVARLRFWHLLEIERIRLNIARDLHDEMGSNLSSISVDSQQLMLQNKKDSKGFELASDIFKTTNETIESIRDIIWFINPKNDGGDNLLFKMREKAATMLAGIKWTFEVTEGLRLDSVRLEVRRNIYLIYKETLTNVIRHSEADTCNIIIDKNLNTLQLSICDNGIGFDISENKHQGGLTNIFYRAEKINAEVNISGNKDRGTCMILKIPVNPARGID